MAVCRLRGKTRRVVERRLGRADCDSAAPQSPAAVHLRSGLCRRVRYWIGDREEFLRRVRSTELSAISVDAVRLAIQRDIAAQKSTLRLVQRGGGRYPRR